VAPGQQQPLNVAGKHAARLLRYLLLAKKTLDGTPCCMLTASTWQQLDNLLAN